MVLSRLLRFALLADAAATAATGLPLFIFSGRLAHLLGLPSELLFYCGLLFIPYAAVVGYLGTRAHVSRAMIWAVIAANLAWAVDSVLVLGIGWIDPAPLGTAFVVAQAVIVAMLAELQYVGLRRSPALAA